MKKKVELPKSLPADQLSTIVVVGGYTVRAGDELRTCACCSSGIRHVVKVEDIDTGASWELGRDCTASNAALSHGIPGRRSQTTNRRFLFPALAEKLRGR